MVTPMRGVKFQSLGRDSVGLDTMSVGYISYHLLVSIPRSGFCWFGPGRLHGGGGRRDEFQSLGRDSVGLDCTDRPERIRRIAQFQSLGRDSVGLDATLSSARLRPSAVSIPRSGFCWFGLVNQGYLGSVTLEFQSLGRDSVGLDNAIQG